jgi:CHAT domain-containing protein
VHRILLFVVLASCIVLLSCSRHRDPQTLYDQARQSLRKGDFTQAETLTKKGYEEFQNTNSEWAWKFMILQATVLNSRDMNKEALDLLASNAMPPPTNDLLIRKFKVEGQAYTSLHKFTEAENKLTEAARLCEGSDSLTCADVLHAQGVLEMNRNHYAQGQAFFTRVLKPVHASGDQYWEASVLLDLSWSANEQTHFDEALDWADEARQIAISHGFADTAQTALGNMGWAYYKLGDYEKALGMFTEAAEHAKKLGDTSDQISWITNAGYVYMDTENIPVAEQSFRESLALARKIKSREDIVNSLIALAFVNEQTGKFADAKSNADEALAMSVADGDKRDQTYSRLVQGQVAAQQHDAASAEAAFHEVEQSPDAPVFLKWQAEHSLAHLYEDENQADSAEREYRSALATFEGARNDLRKMDSKLPFLANATSIYEDFIAFLIAHGKSDEALQWADFNRAHTLKEGLGLLPQGSAFKLDSFNVQQIARRAGGVILFYWVGEKQSYLWAITPQQTKLFNLAARTAIETAVQHYRRDLTGPEDSSDTATNDGAVLYNMLVAPAQSLLPRGAASTVFVIPDGSLNNLNFETLMAPDPKPHYWIEDVVISNASSLRLLQSAQKNNHQAPRLLLFGDAVAAVADYPALRKAADEMQRIENHFPANSQKILARDQATPTAYLASQPEQFSYIHFVAHGTASRSSPLDSAIVLSKASEEEDSFKLYARDIMQHHLRADLVTVSSCYGAGERAFSGEGLVGLSWAFLHAGAHNVIGALWEVSDASTPQLMNDLYANLKKGESPAIALRSAKLSMLHSQSAFRKPFYWAPFQLYTGS